MQHESARSKKVDPDTLPSQAPMKQGGAPRAPKINRAPSADQKKTRRLQGKTAARTPCRGCGNDMLAPRTDDFPLCPECEHGEENRSPGVSTIMARISSSPAYADGFERGRRFGDSFIPSDPEHPWNTSPSLRHRIAAQRMPQSLPQAEVGKFLTGFSQGVAAAHTATVLDTHAERLQPGDRVLGPTGQTLKVKRVRNHETSGDHLYLDTDQGTSLVKRKDQFRLAPHNTTQQEVPGFGIPGANTNTNPFSRDHGQSNQVGSGTCPNCGAQGSMARRGGSYVCSRCGYHEQQGPLGENALLDSDRVIRSFNRLDRGKTAVARRAREVLSTLEES